MQLNQTQMTAVMVDTLHVYLLLARAHDAAPSLSDIHPAIDSIRNVMLMASPTDFQRYVDEFMVAHRQSFNGALRTLEDG
jgi:hypothetical protein